MPITLTTTLSPTGTATFKVYSLHGHGAAGPLKGDPALTDANSGGFEIADGDLIEMVAPGNFSLYYDNVSGLSESDLRKITFTTDMGERYDAQFLSHSYLPSGFATRDPSGPTLGLYRGFVVGHALRGTDMSGNQVLTRDYDGDPGPIGTVDRTVTCTVGDGTNSASITFTVRLSHPSRYYSQPGAYGLSENIAAQVRDTNRRGIIYVSRDGDFTGAPNDRASIFHMTLPDGVITQHLFANQGVSNKQITQYFNDGSSQQIGDFGWPNFEPYCVGIMLKAGETYVWDAGPLPGAGAANVTLGAWGTANNGRAILSGERDRTWNPKPLVMMNENANGYRGTRFSNLEIVASDYDVSDVTWRVWWNELNYTGKSGTFTENTNANINDDGYNGEVITNGSGVYAQVIGDTGSALLVRQIQTTTDFNAQDTTLATFTDGDTLTGQSSGATCTFVAAGSRQDRPRKTPPTFWRSAGSQSSTGPTGMLFDGCDIRGARMAFEYPGEWLMLSDTVIRDYWDYGIFGDAKHLFQNALVIAQPSDYQGANRFFGEGQFVSPNRFTFNTVRSLAGEQNIPTNNDISHAGQRYGVIWGLAMNKCLQHTYGGHGALHQPAVRLGTNGSPTNLTTYAYMNGCGWSGGHVVFNVSTLDNDVTAFRTPKAWVVDNCWIRGDFCTLDGRICIVVATNMLFKDCRIGFPSGVTMANNNKNIRFIAWEDNGGTVWAADPDVSAVPPEVQDTLFEFNADGNSGGSVLGLDTDIRGIAVTYTGTTSAIDATKVSSVDASWT